MTPAEAQIVHYDLLRDWAKKHPDKVVAVYVNVDPPDVLRDVERCRYDAGWPGIKERACIQAWFHNGEFVELSRQKCREDGLPLGEPLDR